jgi:hypothetical protein
MKVARAYTLRLLLVCRNVAIHASRKETRIIRNRNGHISKGFARRYDPFPNRCGPTPTPTVSHDYEPLAILGNPEVLCVQQFDIHYVPHIVQASFDSIKIRAVAIHHSANILDQGNVRAKLVHRRQKSREAIAIILMAILGSAYAEWLTRRPTDHDLCFNWKPSLWGQECFRASTGQVLAIRGDVIGLGLESVRLESS